jgi:hypothetical protein
MTTGGGLGAMLRGYYRTLWAAAAVGVVAVVVGALVGHAVAGVLLVVGLGLGAWNTRMVQNSLARFATGNVSNVRRQLAMSVLRRLALVSAIAIGIAVLYRPDGWTVLAGLAFFQALVIGGATRPLLREIQKG